MRRRPPPPTLFPYTTLFRSWTDEVCAIHDVPPGTQVSLEEAIDFYAPEWRPVIAEHVDRKSTRLNSSHPSISYAVFCLKKKIKAQCHLRASLGLDEEATHRP